MFIYNIIDIGYVCHSLLNQVVKDKMAVVDTQRLALQIFNDI